MLLGSPAIEATRLERGPLAQLQLVTECWAAGVCGRAACRSPLGLCAAAATLPHCSGLLHIPDARTVSYSPSVHQPTLPPQWAWARCCWLRRSPAFAALRRRRRLAPLNRRQPHRSTAHPPTPCAHPPAGARGAGAQGVSGAHRLGAGGHDARWVGRTVDEREAPHMPCPPAAAACHLEPAASPADLHWAADASALPASPTHHPQAGPDPIMALRLLHRLRIFSAVFALPPAAAGGLPDDAFGAASNRLAASAYDEMQAWVRRQPCLLPRLVRCGGDAGLGDRGRGSQLGASAAPLSTSALHACRPGTRPAAAVALHQPACAARLPSALQLHPEHGFDQDARRRCLLAAVLLPVADIQVPAAKGKPVRCGSCDSLLGCGCWGGAGRQLCCIPNAVHLASYAQLCPGPRPAPPSLPLSPAAPPSTRCGRA